MVEIFIERSEKLRTHDRVRIVGIIVLGESLREVGLCCSPVL
jgi:hypothetical protein